MFIVKFIVASLCFLITKMYCTNYCDICINHTLCKFNGTTPGSSCEGYDISVKLTNYDINNIVQKINERRHFVASGLTRNYRLPQAANMRKIVWSNELSKSAQRWADQCDINQHPDKEDECRNLENEDVGQCVASISGSTRGLNVRSFIDFWFMKSLTYIGSISFYNHSTDYSNRQFTQLIWANTHSVGCGRVKFYKNNGRVPIDRLVCNFAPTGNINEETVYAIGFPATQCPKDTVPDATYTSLCALTKAKELATKNNTNDKYFQGIFKLKELIKNETGGNRRQRIRHVWKNEGSGKRDYYFDYEFTSHSPLSDQPVLFNKKVYHQIMPMPTIYQRPSPLRSYKFHKCTRGALKTSNYHALTGCTRKVKLQINNEYFPRSTTRVMTYKNPTTEFPTRRFQCTRGTKTTPTLCTCDLPTKCQCTLTETSKCQGTPCNDMLGDDKKIYFRKFKNPSNSHYDASNNNNIRNNFKPLLLDMPRRNYRNLNKNPFSPQRKFLKRLYKNERKRRQYDIKPFWQENITGRKKTIRSVRYTTLPKWKKKRPAATSNRPSMHNTEVITLKITSDVRGRPNSRVREKYLSFDELMTFRRQNKAVTKKPALSETETDKAKKIHKAVKAGKEKTAKDKASIQPTVYERTGEVITVHEETSNDATAEHESGEEQTGEDKSEGEDLITKKVSHCTRKMTCTWTIPTHAGDKSNIGNGPGGGGGGINGPKENRFGYVEGCTRTSTCTRDFMDKNKFPNTGGGAGGVGGAGGAGGAGGVNGGNDEDYCEKRSLKVQRRNSENNAHKLDNYNNEESKATPGVRQHNDDHRCICSDGMT